jgi:lipopolysaccharide export system permease protein
VISSWYQGQSYVKLLQRYIFREVLVATLGAMALFCLVLVMGNALKELAMRLADGRLSPVVFFQLLGLLIPFVTAFSMPLGFLTGVLIALGRLSASREIIAMKVTGHSIWQISKPVFLLAAVGSVLAIFINTTLAPLARTHYKTIMVQALREDPVRFFKPGVLSRDFPGYVFYLREKTGNELRGFWLWELDRQQRPSVFIRSESGTIRYDRKNDAIILTLSRGLAEQWPGVEGKNDSLEGASVFFEEFPVSLPLSYSLGAARIRSEIGDYPLATLLAMLRDDSALPDTERENPQHFRERILVQVSNHFAMALSLIPLALIGVPLAIRTGRKETYANAMLALGLGLAYYFCVSMISSLSIPFAFAPHLLVWVPNLILVVLGLVQMRRVHRH